MAALVAPALADAAASLVALTAASLASRAFAEKGVVAREELAAGVLDLEDRGVNDFFRDSPICAWKKKGGEKRGAR